MVRNRNAEVEQVADRTVHEGVGLLGERGVGSPELNPVEQNAPDARVQDAEYGGATETPIRSKGQCAEGVNCNVGLGRPVFKMKSKGGRS